MRILIIVVTLLAIVTAACAQARPKTNDSKGKVDAFTVDDKQYGYQRKIWVYTPAGYDAKAATPYPLVISFDGEDYINAIPAPAILDELIAAKKLRPVVQVFVDNSADRLGDLANHQKFADFIAKDLVPWIRKNYRVTDKASETVLAGYSAGGLASSYVALRYPALFGNVLSQSGAYWRGNEGTSSPFEWLTAQFKDSTKLDIRFYLDVGGAENIKNASTFTMLETSTHLNETLKSKGYDVKFVVVEGAVHNEEHWKAQFGPGLIWLLGNQGR